MPVHSITDASTTDEQSRRRVLLYITIDPYDHRDEDGRLRGHGPNLARVREAVEGWNGDDEVRDLWCANLRSEALEDPALLALFLSGSYTEWAEVFRRPAWREQLDTLCALIRETSVPILAVCGSHQLTARAFSDWSAVGHMADAGGPAIPISEEADGGFRGRDPRVGEVGTFHFKRTAQDSLFDGIVSEPDEPLVFTQWHCDQVLGSALPAGAVSMLRPGDLRHARLSAEGEQDGAISRLPGEPPTPYRRRHVTCAEELCRVQALRYEVEPIGRLLYTMQFHPDLPGTDIQGRPDDGIALIRRFLDLAEAYWSRAPE